MTGTAGNDVMVGGRGDDTLDGGAGSDTLIGGAGDDLFIYDAADLRIVGGAGTDTLKVTGGDLDHTAIPDLKMTGIEKIDLSGGGNNTLTLSDLDLLHMTDADHTLTVAGDPGDAVASPTTGWANLGIVTIDGVDYIEFTKGLAKLLVDTDLDHSGIL
ncbi:MAG: hypothetical protein HY521_07815 [Proteobacteria bacterium]|nr:hypothetical protein [Pseudomonadota bacterium]